jgi:hypothetical protein
MFDIELSANWIPIEENVIADAASRFDFKKLADLGFQEQATSIRLQEATTKMSTLRPKLFSYFTTLSPPVQDGVTTPAIDPTSHSASTMAISLSQ